MLFSKVKAAIASFEIGNPLKHMLSPEFVAHQNEDATDISVGLTIYTPDCQIEPGETHTHVSINLACLVPDSFKDEGFDEEQFHHWLCGRLLHMLDHELGESVTVRGKKPYDPHDPVAVKITQAWQD